ncbi:MAG: Ig-like domain-containing protein, partial [Planctomycetota bacterium]
MKRIAWALVLICLVPLAAMAVDGKEIFVAVDVDEAAPSVTFTWDAQVDGVEIHVVRRQIGQVEPSTWNPLAVIDHPDTSYTDASLQPGIAYEYKVYRPYVSSDISSAASYIAVGVQAELVEQRGTMLLVAEESMAQALGPELTQLEMDLVADGWRVIRKDVPRAGDLHPESIRAWIQSQYQADPSQTTGLYLFGRLPFMRGSGSAPDGHGLHEHATDAYYADIDDVWADNGDPTDIVLGTRLIPDRVELINGRVDLAGMDFWNKSETELLRDYLNKAHRFKRAGLDFTRRGTPSGGNTRGEGQLQYSMFGPDDLLAAGISGTGLRDGDGNLIPGNFHWAVDFGNWSGKNYANNIHKALFTINFGSHKQKWTRNNNPMRALLAQPEWGLTCAWGGRPYWFFHTGSLGYPAGDWAKRTQNNRSMDYVPTASSSSPGGTWVNLMGDPSLRMHPVAPPALVQADRLVSQVELTWTASSDPGVLGYNVYRSSERLGNYVKLNGGNLIDGTVFTDPTPPASGDLWYQVRAVKLESVYTGSYYNQSLGSFAKLADGAASSNATPSLSVPSGLSTEENVPLLFELGGSDPEGDALHHVIVDHPEHGMLSGEPPRLVYHPDPGFTGTDSFRVAVSDGITQSAAATVDITVAGSPLLSWSFDNTSDSQDLSSDSNVADVLAANITVGAGLSTPTGLSYEDAAAVKGVGSSSLNLDDYLAFTFEPVAGKAAALDRVVFSVFDRDASPFDIELRFSVDDFATWRAIPIAMSQDMLRGIGQNISDGIYCVADCADIAELQTVVEAVEFRLYIWNADRSGIGKSGLGYTDLAITGSTADASAPVALAMVSDSIGPLTVGKDLQQALVAQGGAAPYTWTVASGALPGDLSLSESGVVSGTPTAAGSTGLTIRVQDSAAAQVDRDFTLVVEAAPALSPPVAAVGLSGQGNRLTTDLPPVPANGSDFGDVPMGDFLANTFTVTNTGEIAVTGLSLQLNGDAAFDLTSPLSVSSLAAGASTDVEVTFTPSGIGSVGTALELDADQFASTVSFELAGRGVGDAISFVDGWAGDDEDTAGVMLIEIERTGNGIGSASVDVVVDTETGQTTADAEDYSYTPTTLTWADGELGIKTVSVTIHADSEVEESEEIKFELANFVNSRAGSYDDFGLSIYNDDFIPKPYEYFS